AGTNSVLLTPYQPRGFSLKNIRLSILGVTKTSVESATGAYLDGARTGVASNFYGDVPVQITAMKFASARATRRIV
ncbi:MAG: hypothetical protein ACKO5E_13625, partial [bacterium]